MTLKSKKDLLDQSLESLTPQTPKTRKKASVFMNSICPVCGETVSIYFLSNPLYFRYSEDEGGVFTWECGSCETTGREHYNLFLKSSDVSLPDGTNFEDIPDAHIAEIIIDSETFDTLIPESVNYCVNSDRKNELILSKTVDFRDGYSAELRVIADSEGEEYFINVRLLHNNEIVYDHNSDDAYILRAWPLQDGNGNKFLLVVKEGE